MNLIEIRDLCVAFNGQTVVRNLSLDVRPGECLALVGESGSGKSVTAHSILQLLPQAGTETLGSIKYRGQELIGASPSTLQKLRGNRIAMIFQEPMTSLNPLHSIEKQIGETLLLHKGLGGKAAQARILELLELVGIQKPQERLKAYPHQLSGGQRQRVMIAMALACEPELLIADEPTTALDVTVQQQILGLIGELVAERGMALILISHDLGVIAQNVDRMLVMYGGTVVERGPTAEVFSAMAHPYTRGLFAARPRLNVAAPLAAGADAPGGRMRLPTIAGTVPELVDLPPGCPFAGRCGFTVPDCYPVLPPAVPLGEDHSARCIRLDAVAAAAQEGRA